MRGFYFTKNGEILMITKQQKREIRLKIHGELKKKKPNMSAVRDMYAMIEDVNAEKDCPPEEKVKHAKPKGRDSKQYIDVGLEVEHYIDLRLNGFIDRDIAELCGVGTTKIANLRKEWGLKHIYKVGAITEQQYVRMRRNGLTLQQICENCRMDRSSLYNMRKKWGRLNDYYNFDRRKRKGE